MGAGEFRHTPPAQSLEAHRLAFHCHPAPLPTGLGTRPWRLKGGLDSTPSGHFLTLSRLSRQSTPGLFISAGLSPLTSGEAQRGQRTSSCPTLPSNGNVQDALFLAFYNPSDPVPPLRGPGGWGSRAPTTGSRAELFPPQEDAGHVALSAAGMRTGQGLLEGVGGGQ